MSRSSTIRLAIPLAAALLATTSLSAQPLSKLEKVADFPHQVTGVAVAKDGRVFVNFPRWTEDSPVSVAEVKGGKLVAYPDADWNSWRNVKKDEVDPKTHFVCVQSVVADGQGSLWVVDAAAPALEQIVKGGPKLVQVDLATNKVVKTIPFDERVAPIGSYLNDIRISPDGLWGYLSESGRGALIVVNLKSGEVRRLLDGVTSTQAEKGVAVTSDGKVLRRPDGRTPTFNADGIALSADGATFYWQAISSHTLYSIPTDAMRDASLSPADLEGKVKREGTTIPADGLWLSPASGFYFTSPEDNAVKRRGADGKFATVVQDKRLRWPDSMAEGADGRLYVTSSRIPDNAMFKPNAPIALPTQLWRFAPPK